MSHTYIFLGDSITESNRFWLPLSNGLGDGYVSMISQKLTSQIPDLNCINRGIDGFTVPAVLTSIKNMPLDPAAELISLLIGINDIGVSINTNTSIEDLEFAQNYSSLLKMLKSTNARILCMGPFIFPHPQKYHLWIPSVYKLENIMSDIAATMNIPFIKLHDYLNHHIPEGKYNAVTTDGFHLTALGNQILTDYIYPYYQ